MCDGGRDGGRGNIGQIGWGGVGQIVDGNGVG